MTVLASSLIAEGSRASHAETWATGRLLRADWASGLQVRTQWLTSQTPTRSDSEVRRALRGRPTRVVSVRVAASDRDSTANLEALLFRMGTAGFLQPLFHEQARTASASASGQPVVALRTGSVAVRQFHTGARIAIYQPGRDRFHGVIEVGVIDSIAGDELTLSSNLATSWPKGSRVVPLMEARFIPTLDGSFISGRVGELIYEAVEPSGPMALPGRAASGAWPSGIQTSLGHPILPIPYNYASEVRIGAVRSSTQGQSGTADVHEAWGIRPRLTGSVLLSHFDRAAAWRNLAFLDALRGRSRPFFLVSPLEVHEPLTISTSSLELVATGHVFDWQDRTHVSLVLRDGTIQVRAIQSVSRLAGVDTVTLATALSPVPTLAQVRSVRDARLVRLSFDEILETWRTDEIGEVRVDFTEVIGETAVSVEDLVDLSTVGLTTRFTPEICLGVCLEACEDIEEGLPASYTVSGLDEIDLSECDCAETCESSVSEAELTKVEGKCVYIATDVCVDGHLVDIRLKYEAVSDTGETCRWLLQLICRDVEGKKKVIWAGILEADPPPVERDCGECSYFDTDTLTATLPTIPEPTTTGDAGDDAIHDFSHERYEAIRENAVLSYEDISGGYVLFGLADTELHTAGLYEYRLKLRAWRQCTTGNWSVKAVVEYRAEGSSDPWLTLFDLWTGTPTYQACKGISGDEGAWSYSGGDGGEGTTTDSWHVQEVV